MELSLYLSLGRQFAQKTEECIEQLGTPGCAWDAAALLTLKWNLEVFIRIWGPVLVEAQSLLWNLAADINAARIGISRH